MAPCASTSSGAAQVHGQSSAAIKPAGTAQCRSGSGSKSSRPRWQYRPPRPLLGQPFGSLPGSRPASLRAASLAATHRAVGFFRPTCTTALSFRSRKSRISSSPPGPWLFRSPRDQPRSRPTQTGSTAVQQRSRLKQLKSLEERLAEDAKRLREEAKLLPPGCVRELVLGKARQAEAGLQMTEWLTSPRLRPPKHV